MEFSVVVLIFLGLYLLTSVKILAEYERGTVFRLDRVLRETKGPGLIVVFRPIDRMVRMSLQVQALEARPSQDSRDPRQRDSEG